MIHEIIGVMRFYALSLLALLRFNSSTAFFIDINQGLNNEAAIPLSIQIPVIPVGTTKSPVGQSVVSVWVCGLPLSGVPVHQVLFVL